MFRRPAPTRLSCLAASLMALTTLPATLSAVTVISLDFEDGTGHTNTIPATHYAGLTLSNAAWIDSVFPFGTFADGSYGLGTDLGASGNAWAFPGTASPTVLVFDDGALASLFRIQAFDVGSNGALIRAFDASGGLLGSDSAVGTGSGGGNHPVLSVTAPGIKTVHLLQLSGAGGDGLGWDNLYAEVGADPIPEPTRAALFALAAGAITLRRRRR